MGAIVLIGPKTCPNCAATQSRIETKFDTVVKKVTIDHDNAEHVRLIATATDQGYKEAPIIVHEHDDGTLDYIAAGISMLAQTATDVYIKSHRDALATAGA